MDNRTPEREWLQKVAGNVAKGNTHKEVQEKGTKEKNSPQPSPSKKGKGLEDVAGMTQLKELIVEGFINVLRNRTCAEAYGIKPPSLLLYGPAGCGKTFFAEKMAEELGIHFMKIVPDDLVCTWIHGTQQKIGELFREAEKKAPTLMFFDEFDAMVPKRSENDANQSYNGEVNEFLCMLNNACERAGVMRLHRSPYTKEEKLKLALDYLEKQGAMHIIDYMELTGLSRTTATLELQEFRDDHSSGIDFIGRGKTKAYIKRR